VKRKDIKPNLSKRKREVDIDEEEEDKENSEGSAKNTDESEDDKSNSDSFKSDSDEETKPSKKKKQKTESKEIKKSKEPVKLSKKEEEIKKYKNLIRQCRLTAKLPSNFKTLKSNDDIIFEMKKVLESYGLTGKIGKEKLSTVKKQREDEIELEEMDKNLIIEGKRNRKKPNEIYSPPPTPTKRVKANKPADDPEGGDNNKKQVNKTPIDDQVSEPEPSESESEDEDDQVSDYQDEEDED